MVDEKNSSPGFDADGVPAEGAPQAGPAQADSTGAESEETADTISEERGEDEGLTVQDILDAAEAEQNDPSAEHLADLKRVSAEYANYRKRTEDNRVIERERVIGDVLNSLLPVLDDFDRAEKHGDLVEESAFATIAAKTRATVAKLGLVPFGAVGDVFDHNIHEAIFQQPSDEVETETVADVVETGYLIGSTLLRAAKVVVKVPA